MPDRGKIIKGLEEAEIMLIQAVDRGGEINRVTDALKLLKKQTDEIKELRSIVEFWKNKALHT